MLAYSTTKPREDGPILSNPEGTRPISLLDVALSGLKGTDPTAPLKASQKRNGPRQRHNRDCQQALA